MPTNHHRGPMMLNRHAWPRRSQNVAGQVAALGKIPSFPEFLRADSALARNFDDWLCEGMELAGHRYGSLWRPTFEAGEVYGFMWSGQQKQRTDAILCGMLLPSQDSLGRHYPLAIVTTLSTQSVLRAPHVVPLAMGDFLERAYLAILGLAHLSPDGVQRRMGALAPPSAADLCDAAEDYDGWCAATPIADGWSGIFDGNPAPEARRVVDALAPLVAPPSVSEAMIRLPLGRGGAAAAALWLDIVRRLHGGWPPSCSVFWNPTQGHLMVGAGAASPGALSELWLPDHGNEAVRDLTFGEPPATGMAGTAYAENGAADSMMRDFLQTLRRGH